MKEREQVAVFRRERGVSSNGKDNKCGPQKRNIIDIKWVVEFFVIIHMFFVYTSSPKLRPFPFKFSRTPKSFTYHILCNNIISSLYCISLKKYSFKDIILYIDMFRRYLLLLFSLNKKIIRFSHLNPSPLILATISISIELKIIMVNDVMKHHLFLKI